MSKKTSANIKIEPQGLEDMINDLKGIYDTTPTSETPAVPKVGNASPEHETLSGDNQSLSYIELKNLYKHLDRAYDIRKFEIDLLWKRASYFWGFLIATFAGYFTVSDSGKFGTKPSYQLLVICIGFAFSLSWYLVNRASLYWQLNAERMIDTIEAKLKTPYYSYYLDNKYKKLSLTSPYSFSVSGVNIFISLFVTFIWLLLGADFARGHFIYNGRIDFKQVGIVASTLFFCGWQNAVC